MKCDDCINILEAYVDHESTEREAEQVREHLMKCAACTAEFEAFGAERELYERYDRELQISPAMWNGIAARIATEQVTVERTRSESRGWFAGLFAMPRLGFAFSGAAAVLIAAVTVGYLYVRTRPAEKTPITVARNDDGATVTPPPSDQTPNSVPTPTSGPGSEITEPRTPAIAKVNSTRRTTPKVDDSGDVLFREAAYGELDDRDTASHLEQAENLLTSFRAIQSSDDDDEIDVSYEKTESRRLLNENVVLRRGAELNGKFPAKSVLGSLEPFLIDIANLPDKATARDVQQIKDRVQRTEIVAELRIY